jgi:hypothetical protein
MTQISSRRFVALAAPYHSTTLERLEPLWEAVGGLDGLDA